jgi:hypothetical protein
MPRRETPTDDNNRTRELLDHADAAFETDDSAFADVVMNGLMTDVATRPYPPAGHDYPRH